MEYLLLPFRSGGLDHRSGLLSLVLSKPFSGIGDVMAIVPPRSGHQDRSRPAFGPIFFKLGLEIGIRSKEGVDLLLNVRVERISLVFF